jgi:hypothetical protein
VELLGRLAYGEAAVNFEYRHSGGLADVDFHGQPVSHGSASIYPYWVATAIRLAEGHYTLQGKLHKGKHARSLQANIPEREESDASEKRIHRIAISKGNGEPACV